MSDTMKDKYTLIRLAKRLEEGRQYLLREHPFFGRLLVHLKFGLAKCSTAYTDMENIVFDPDFLDRLTDNEMHFVILHEVMHCVLKHCVRGLTLNDTLYNIACDIVVNSFVMDTLRVSSFTVDGCDIMHLTPKKAEGRYFTAEEVYMELMSELNIQFGEAMAKGCLDCHEPWTKVDGKGTGDMWDKNIGNAARYCSDKGSGIPDSIKRIVEDIEHKSETDWRQLLHDFIRHDRCDYTFAPPDRRYIGEDIILPSFTNCADGESVENIWFFVDTSGSFTDEELAKAFAEIKEAASQVENMSGYVCFFDTDVSDFVSFDSAEDIDKITPVGGGGTSFYAVFDYIKNIPEDKKPSMVAIITDGYADYPDEPEIPVIWLLTDKESSPPWGESVYIS